jgi:pachytene checkpoint protein 2
LCGHSTVASQLCGVIPFRQSIAAMEDMKIPVHVEVEMTSESLMSQDAVESLLRDKFKKSYPLFRQGLIPISSSDPFCNDVVRISLCELGVKEVPFWKAELLFYVYRNLEGEPEKDYLEGTGEEELPACDQWELPNQALSRLWESIVVEDHIKTDILGYATSAMIFTSAMIDPDIISWNRMILLHGPPGENTYVPKTIIHEP